MTAPALTDEQQAQLRVLATTAALAYHDASVPEGERVDVAASYALHGDLRLVAADVLEAACLHARQQPGSNAAGATRKIKVGPIEVEKVVSAATDPTSVLASAWCERATRLRKEASSRTGLIRSPVAGMVGGSNPDPVFRVTRQRKGP